MAVKCARCNGCGRIADTDEGEAWTEWMNLPVESAAAVILGIVKPVPCPECGGSGVCATLHPDAAAGTGEQS